MFEKYAKSSLLQDKDKFKPVVVRVSRGRLLIQLKELLKKEKYENIIVDDNFSEVFGIDSIYEITFHLVDEGNGNTRIVTSIYTPTKKGKAKKHLVVINEWLKKQFENVLCR